MFDKRRKLNPLDEWDPDIMFGPKMNFAVSEAYKLLRTNIMYSFSTEPKCHIVGVMSSVRGEGKSTTACNLAYSFSEAGKRTLLIEADLRLPTVAEKLSLKPTPGLSDMLVMHEKLGNVLQRCEHAKNMDIITAGRFTPNPSELLGSTLMKDLLDEMTKYYDYIILDLPPVTAVSDALVVSKLLDGVIMVVRKNYVTRKEFNDAMRQLELVGVRILGFAGRGGGKSERHYRNKASYHRYTKRI